ncbi:hypothetical protein SAMN02745108_00771, partial [Fibrobacter intestinalis]
MTGRTFVKAEQSELAARHCERSAEILFVEKGEFDILFVLSSPDARWLC